MLILQAGLRHKELKSLTQSHTAVTGGAGTGALARPILNALRHERHFKSPSRPTPFLYMPADQR